MQAALSRPTANDTAASIIPAETSLFSIRSAILGIKVKRNNRNARHCANNATTAQIIKSPNDTALVAAPDNAIAKPINAPPNAIAAADDCCSLIRCHSSCGVTSA